MGTLLIASSGVFEENHDKEIERVVVCNLSLSEIEQIIDQSEESFTLLLIKDNYYHFSKGDKWTLAVTILPDDDLSDCTIHYDHGLIEHFLELINLICKNGIKMCIFTESGEFFNMEAETSLNEFPFN